MTFSSIINPSRGFRSWTCRIPRGSYFRIRFRSFAPPAVGDHRLIRLLSEAARKILVEIYKQRSAPGLDDQFKGLREDDIHQIRVAQTYLLAQVAQWIVNR